jgi:hypothetical protein
MRQNCDKYLKNAKISLFFLATLFIVVILKEIGFFKQFLDTDYRYRCLFDVMDRFFYDYRNGATGTLY